MFVRGKNFRGSFKINLLQTAVSFDSFPPVKINRESKFAWSGLQFIF